MISQEPRVGERSPARFRVGEWLIDPALDEISRGTEVIKLEPRMMRLLCQLAESHGQVISSQELLDNVWAGVVVGPASVYQAVSALRKLLGDTGTPATYIATVPRKGYRLVAAVEATAASLPTGATSAAQPGPSDPAKAPRRGRWVWGVATAVLASLAIAAWIGLRGQSAISPSPGAAPAQSVADLPSLAILPFQPGASDDDSKSFALVMTSILHDRLISQDQLLVISLAAARALGKPDLDVRDVGKRLHAKYLLRGEATHQADQLRVGVRLVEAASGATVWTNTYARSEEEITALREEIIARVGEKLEVKIRPVGNVPIDFAAYTLFWRGQESMQKLTRESVDAASEIFYRTTTLYPEFARGYLGYGQSLFLKWLRDQPDAERLKALFVKAYDRALELDPDFGEALLERAQFVDDDVKAEEMFRRGLQLAPNYDLGAYRYSVFLVTHGRPGESFVVIERGLRSDPLSIMLLVTKAQILLNARGDLAGHDRVMGEVLALYPDFTLALIGLGDSKLLAGETAEGIRYFERELARDPGSGNIAYLATVAYLEADDLAAAVSVAKDNPFAALEIATFRHQSPNLARLSNEQRMDGWGVSTGMAGSPLANAVRDEAASTGNYSSALAWFDAVRSNYKGPPGGIRAVVLVHAHTLILSGDTERGREIVRSQLRFYDTEEIGRPKNWFARERASAYAMLGDDERALQELANSQKLNYFGRWWYTADMDPAFAHLRNNPRFQALAAAAKSHRAEQRQLLDEMRRKGEVPRRPS